MMRKNIYPWTAQSDMTFEDMMHIVANTKLRDLLLERNIAVDQMEKIDKQLSGVRNNKTV